MLGTPAVLIALIAVVVAQLALTYVPVMQELFGTEPIAPMDGVLILGVGVTLLMVVEIEKRLGAPLIGPRPA